MGGGGNSTVIDEMASQNFITPGQAALLRSADAENSQKASWFVATIHHHMWSGDKTLSDEQFARLCLMGIHRYEARNGEIDNAPESPRVKDLFTHFSQLGVPESTQDGRGLLHAIRNYLTRTPKAAGEEFVSSLETMLKDRGMDWQALDREQNPVAVFNLRAQAEDHYIEDTLRRKGSKELEPIKKAISTQGSLISLLPT